jgi:hypothetical protein
MFPRKKTVRCIKVREGNLKDVVPNMGRDQLPLMRCGIHENPLDEIVSILIASDYEGTVMSDCILLQKGVSYYQ